jgi:translocation and assembly module TamB
MGWVKHHPGRIAAGVGGSVLLLGGVGSVMLWQRGTTYLHDTVVPQLSEDLSTSLNRPVHLGKVDSLSLTQVRLGPSAIPATASDADAVEIESIVVRFDWLTAIRDQVLELDVTLVHPQIFLDQNGDGAWIETQLELDEDEQITIKHLRIRDGAIALVPHAEGFNGDGVLHPKATVTLPNQFEFDNLHADVALGENMDGFKFRARAHSKLDGTVAVRGEADLAPESPHSDVALDVAITTNQFSALPLNLALPPSVRLIDGQITSQLQIQMRPDMEPIVEGTVDVAQLSAWVKGEPNPFTETTGQFQIRGQEIQLTDGFTRYGEIPFDVQGRIHLTHGLDLDAQVSSVPVADFMDAFNLGLPFPVAGALMSDNLRITGPLDYAVFSGTVANAVPIDMDRLTLRTLQTDFEFDTQRDRLLLQDTTAIPQVGGAVTLNGEILLDSGDNDEVALTVDAQDLPGEAIAQLYDLPLPPGALGSLYSTATVAISAQQPTINMQWRNQSPHYPAAGTVNIEGDRLTVSDTVVHVAQHPISIDGAIADGQWKVTLDTSDMPIDTWMPDADWGGAVTGELALMGPLNDLTPAAMSAIAQLKLTEVQRVGMPQHLIPPIDLDLQWQDSRLNVAAIADALSVKGWVGVSADSVEDIQITDSQLALHLQDYDLAMLPVRQADGVEVRGKGTVRGVFTGTPEHPKLQGDIQLHHVGINAFDFEPDLTGDFGWTPDIGTQLQLIGQEEAIALSLHPSGALNAFEIQLKQGSIQGTALHSGSLRATVNQLPLQTVTALGSSLLPSPFVEAVSGDVSAHIVAHLTDRNQPEVAVDFAIDRPWLDSAGHTSQSSWDVSRHAGDRLSGSVRYANDHIRLTDGTLQVGNSRANLNAQARLTSNASLAAYLQIHHGDLRDIASWLQPVMAPSIFPVDLQAVSPNSSGENGTPDVPMAFPFDVNLLSGTFDGDVQVSASADAPVDIRASLNGQNWFVGPLGIQHISVDHAKLQGKELDFSRLEVPDLQVSGLLIDTSTGDRHQFDTHLQLSRSAAGEWQGRAEAKDISIATLAQLLELPVTVTGDVDAIASLSGNTNIPQIAGTVGIDNACISTLALKDIDVDVSHHQGLLSVANVSIPSATVNELALSFGLTPQQAFLPAKTESDVEHRAVTSSAPYSTIPTSTSSLLEQVVISYGPLALSLPLRDLETLAATGSIPSAWRPYLNLAGISADDLRQGLNQSAQVDVVLVDRLLNSPFGQELLTSVGQVVRTPSRQTSVQALRAALVMAAQDDNQLSLLELFQQYPLQELHIDAAQLIRMMENTECSHLN